MAFQQHVPAEVIAAKRRAAQRGDERDTAPTVVIQPSHGLAALSLRAVLSRGGGRL